MYTCYKPYQMYQSSIHVSIRVTDTWKATSSAHLIKNVQEKTSNMGVFIDASTYLHVKVTESVYSCRGLSLSRMKKMLKLFITLLSGLSSLAGKNYFLQNKLIYCHFLLLLLLPVVI